MTEEEARAWLSARVPRETITKLEAFVRLLSEEASRQNLVSAASLTHMWARHIVDSAQLADFAPSRGRWVDLGAGAGLPGLVIGIVGDHDVMLVESRAKRVAFLNDCIASLGLGGRVQVRAGRVEALAAEPFDVISARAFAPLDRLFGVARHLGEPSTRWILPKGRSAKAELEVAGRSWQGAFSIVASVTDPEAGIIVATDVRPRARISDSRSTR